MANVKVMTGKVPSLKILLKSYSINISYFTSCLRKQLMKSSFYSFLLMSPDLDPAQETFEHETSFYMLGVSPLQSTCLLEQVAGLPFRTTCEQVHLISLISNFHWDMFGPGWAEKAPQEAASPLQSLSNRILQIYSGITSQPNLLLSPERFWATSTPDNLVLCCIWQGRRGECHWVHTENNFRPSKEKEVWPEDCPNDTRWIFW